MKRILLCSALAVALSVFTSGNAFAQRGGRGGNGAREGGIGPAHVEAGPAVRTEAPALGNEYRGNEYRGNEFRGNAVPGNHPFYGNDRGGENDWRYRYNDGRWWYWTPGNAWAYWNNGQWADYSGVPYTANYGGTSAPVGWYWNDSQKRYYWFDGTTLTAAQQ